MNRINIQQYVFHREDQKRERLICCTKQDDKSIINNFGRLLSKDDIYDVSLSHGNRWCVDPQAVERVQHTECRAGLTHTR